MVTGTEPAAVTAGAVITGSWNHSRIISSCLSKISVQLVLLEHKKKLKSRNAEEKLVKAAAVKVGEVSLVLQQKERK